mmetsp:Transcript_30784/g.47518  ORF Transcript_30784/g.47518 Transcript_30784/m.47518 type:complete len:121 (+) Transcript_30784:36-398(+)
MLSSKLIASAAFVLLSAMQAMAAEETEKLEDMPKGCPPEALGDDEHYCRFVFEDRFNEVAWGGAVATAVCVVLVALTIIARDVLKLWDCCGVTQGSAPKAAPLRSLTTMSAAYAPNTQPH